MPKKDFFIILPRSAQRTHKARERLLVFKNALIQPQ